MEAKICIVGSRVFHNELIRWYLEETTNLCCRCEWIEDSSCKSACGLNGVDLILWDCPKVDWHTIWPNNGCAIRTSFENVHVALFNVPTECGIEDEALRRGVHGVFFNKDRLDIFRKGILAILDGDLWYSRETLLRYLEDTKGHVKQTQKEQNSLTRRETEILLIMASGATNDEIAEKLFISPYTVKTHVYNIFHKINVPNRLKAAMWASENL